MNPHGPAPTKEPTRLHRWLAGHPRAALVLMAVVQLSMIVSAIFDIKDGSWTGAIFAFIALFASMGLPLVFQQRRREVAAWDAGSRS
ncbi:hypothetical protein D1871_19600 [Nakamurella silvestris]|nr:hypothetical protein D1871_19600 [Nakamurella silvestris]